MRTRLKLNPGQPGTKKLAAQYGEQLVCVRYRYDARKKKRYKTVELIIDEAHWEPKVKPMSGGSIVGVRVGISEVSLQQRVKRAGGRWNPKLMLWEMRYDRVLGLGLRNRIERRVI